MSFASRPGDWFKPVTEAMAIYCILINVLDISNSFTNRPSASCPSALVPEKVNAPAIQGLTEIYQAGVASGDFRSGLNVVELHWFISSMCFFNNSNRSTFSAAFGTEIFSDAGQERLRKEVEELICRYVSA